MPQITHRLLSDLISTLTEVSEYCDNRADADFDGEQYRGNAEMMLGQSVDSVLDSLRRIEHSAYTGE